MRAIKLLLVLMAFGASAVRAGLEEYSDLIVSDAASGGPPRSGVRVTYLGTNAYLLESRDTALLIDPYFSRVGLSHLAMNLPAVSQRALVQRYLPVRKIDAVLVTHGHIDHLLDAPEVMRLTGAKLIASAASVRLVESLGLPGDRCIPVTGGQLVRAGGATVRVFAVRHDRLLCCVPFNGPPQRLPPRRVSDWVCGEPLAFLIEMGGQRIYIESGGQPAGPYFPGIGRVDLAILGVALPDARKRFPKMLRWMRPRHVLPSHQDDFFRPLSRGFIFGPMTDFGEVRRAFDAVALPSSRLVLLDYFRPWTLR